MCKVIHISDLHIRHPESEEKVALNRLASKVKTAVAKLPGKKAVVITGDLVHDATQTGQTGFESIRKTLAEAFPSNEFSLLVCPGNHDYGPGKNADPKFVPLFKQVFFGDRPDWNSKEFYPFVETVGDVAFLGLDSTAEEFGFFDLAQGEIGTSQLERLAARLRNVKGCRKRVVFLHHDPFYYLPGMRLRDHIALRKVFADALAEGISIDLLLHGHSHHGTYQYWGCPEVMQCFDGGTSLKHTGTYAEKFTWCQSSVVRIIDIDGLSELENAGDE